MGSFNSAPKIVHKDNQDDEKHIPGGLTKIDLLKHINETRGKATTLIPRKFLKPMISEPLDHHSIARHLSHLHLGSAPCEFVEPQDQTTSLKIRLLQWNILSQALGQYSDGFVCCPQEALEWDNRKFLIVEEIIQTTPDIICLQEVDHFKFLKNYLGSLNYKGVFIPKPDSPCLYIKNNNGPDGCAIFYNCEKFDMMNKETRILEVWRVQSNQVAIGVNLFVKSIGKEICVCTTHLKARRGTLLSKLRNEQGRDLLRFVEHFAENRPVLLCGDFNAEPIEPVYATILSYEFLKLSSAYSDLNAMDDTSNKYETESKYNLIQKSMHNEPEYTTWKIRENGEECHTIDYIFYSKDYFKVQNCLLIPQEGEIGKSRTPNMQYPSDHFSLVCDFEIITQSSE